MAGNDILLLQMKSYAERVFDYDNLKIGVEIGINSKEELEKFEEELRTSSDEFFSLFSTKSDEELFELINLLQAGIADSINKGEKGLLVYADRCIGGEKHYHNGELQESRELHNEGSQARYDAQKALRSAQVFCSFISTINYTISKRKSNVSNFQSNFDHLDNVVLK